MDRLAARGNAMELEEPAAAAAAPAADPAAEPVAEKLAEKLAAVEEKPAAGDKPAAAAPVKVKPAGKAGHVSQLSTLCVTIRYETYPSTAASERGKRISRGYTSDTRPVPTASKRVFDRGGHLRRNWRQNPYYRSFLAKYRHCTVPHPGVRQTVLWSQVVWFTDDQSSLPALVWLTNTHTRLHTLAG